MQETCGAAPHGAQGAAQREALLGLMQGIAAGAAALVRLREAVAQRTE
jgi:hypothetical protein